MHHYLAQLRAGRLAVFLTGRRFETASFRDALTGKVVARVCDGWQTLAELAEFLEENDETLTIFIDAVNEYSGPAGPRSLLESMIAEIGGDHLRRARLVASCRGETWKQYQQYLGVERPLDPALFHTPDGDAVRVGRFETPELCSRLYAAYRDYYKLQPQSFEELTSAVSALIAQPFMMAIIGETYSNRAHPGEASGEEAWHVVPPDLDYFSLFERLTRRKAGDAQILVPASDVAYRALMPEWMEEFCELLAGMIFERLTTQDPRVTSGRDALPIDSVSKRAELEQFVQNRHAISVLEATLQVGLLELTRIQQLDRQGRERAGAAYVFFHDQYTQYCLAAVYQTRILGLLDAQTLADPALLDTMLGKIDAVITQSVKAPILAGALDHWLQKNIKIFHGGRIEPVIALLDRLAGHGSPALRHQAVAFVSHLILRGSFSPQGILGPIFSTGTPELKRALVNAFVDFWPALQPAALQTFIDCCDSREDGELIDRLGDIFVLHLALDPPLAADYLGKAISPLSLTSLAGPMRSYRQSRFGLQFTIFAVMTCFDQPAAVQAARDFFRAKYRPLLSLLAESRRDNAWTRVTRKGLNGIFDNFGVSQWNKFIVAAQQSGNERFFLETDGVVQQALLAQFLPYVIDLHNGEFDRLSLAEGTPFRDLVLRMLQFRVMSIVGYNALICLPAILLRQDWAVTRSLVMALVGQRTPPGLFFGQLLLVNLAYSDPASALPALELLRDHVIAQLLGEEVDNDWSISFCIATLDVDALWPAFEGLLQHFFRHFDQRADPAACAAFGDHLYKVCYCQDRMLGQRLIALMLGDSARFLGGLWRACTLKVLAAMLTRSPATLYAALAAQGIDESLAREARSYQSAEIIKQSRLFPFQIGINRFIAWLFVGEPRLRRAVVKYVIGSLARGSSAEDFPPGIRQMAVTLIKVFFGDDPEQIPQGRIGIEEIDAAIAQARRFW